MVIRVISTLMLLSLSLSLLPGDQAGVGFNTLGGQSGVAPLPTAAQPAAQQQPAGNPDINQDVLDNSIQGYQLDPAQIAQARMTATFRTSPRSTISAEIPSPLDQREQERKEKDSRSKRLTNAQTRNFKRGLAAFGVGLASGFAAFCGFNFCDRSPWAAFASVAASIAFAIPVVNELIDIKQPSVATKTAYHSLAFLGGISSFLAGLQFCTPKIEIKGK